MEYAEFRCQICGAKDRTLNVHHSYYVRGRNPWEYPAGSLICICEVCHEKIHAEPPRATAAEPPTDDYAPPLASIVPREAVARRFEEIRAAIIQAP